MVIDAAQKSNFIIEYGESTDIGIILIKLYVLDVASNSECKFNFVY